MSMSKFFMLIWFITLIAFIIGWWMKRKAHKSAGDSYKTDEKYLKISKIKRIIGVVCVLSFVLTSVTQTPEEKAAQQQRQELQKQKAEEQKQAAEAEKQAKKEAEEAEKQAKQQEKANKINDELLAFSNKIFNEDSKGAERWQNDWPTILNGLGDGSVDRFTAYNGLKNLAKAMQQTKSAIESAKVPKDIPEDEQQKLSNDVKSNLSTVYYIRKKAAEDMADMLDNGKITPSGINKIKENLQQQDSLTILGVSAGMDVFSKHGLEFKKQQ